MANKEIKGIDYLKSTDSVNGIKDDQFIALRDELQAKDSANKNLKFYKPLINEQLLEMKPYDYLRSIGVSERIINQTKDTLYEKCQKHNQNSIYNIIVPNDKYPIRSDFHDLSGETYGRLKVLKWLGRDKTRQHTYYMCECECGNHKICAGNLLVNGTIRSCGCMIMEANIIHGCTKSRLHNKWLAMHQRCYEPNTDSYYLYGGKGIKICDEWRKGCGINGIHPFIAFRNWAYENGYSDIFEENMELDVSIDRIDNDKDYSPDNCRIANAFIQANNRSFNHLLTIGEFTFPISIWARILDLNHDLIYKRCKRGWTDMEALFTPLYSTNPNPVVTAFQVPDKYLCLNRIQIKTREEFENEPERI